MTSPPPAPAALQASLEALEWPRLLDALRERLRSGYGHAALDAFGFLDDVESVRRSQTLIAELRGLLEASAALPLGALPAVAPLLERAEKQGRLEVPELAAVLAVQGTALAIQALLRSRPDLPGLQALASGVHGEQALCQELQRAITPAQELDERAFPQLARLRHELRQHRERIHRLLEHLLQSPGLAPALQEKIYTLRGHRYVLPVKIEARSQLPGIVHDVSASGATLFIEPQQVVDETNALTLVEKRLDLEQDAILRELSLHVGYAAVSLRHNLDWLGGVDLLHAQTLLCQAYRGTTPDVWREGQVELRGLAHPLLLLAGQDPVRNDLSLGGPTRCLIVSGANAGGKTVLLKAVGLCALLVRAGMPIPAGPGSRLDLFPQVWAQVGDQQSLQASLSTFSSHVRFLAELLEALQPGSLVLLDELLTGTEPQEGAALAGQVVRALVRREACALVTTHYPELKLLAGEVPQVANASMAFDAQALRPTYRLLRDLPGASYAFPIALRHGLPPELVRAAQEGLAQRPAALDALLRQVQDQALRLQALEAELAQRQGLLAQQQAGLERRARELEALQERLRAQERGTVSRELRRAREQIAAVIRQLQGANSLPLAGRAQQQLTALASELLAATPAPAAGVAALPMTGLAPGDPVYVPSLDRSGVLREVVAGGQMARVQLGSLMMELPLGEVRRPGPGAAAGPGGASGAGSPGGRLGAGSASGAGQPVPQAIPRNVRPAPQPAGLGPGASRPPGRWAGTRAPAGAPHPPFQEPEAGAVTTPAGTTEAMDQAPAVGPVFATAENTLDVRGLRLEEAWERAERFFDQCVVKHISPVVLIHGHGTGRLKAGLRGQLGGSPYVQAWRAGGRGEGQDGVTVIALNL